MLFKSYPHTNHKAIKFVKLRVSMWIIRRKNFFNFSLLPVARLNCYSLQAIFFLSILTNRAFMRIIKTESVLRQQPSEIPWIYLSKWPSSVSAGGGHFLFLWGVGQNFYLPDLEICLIIGSRIRRSRRDPNL